MEPLDGIELLRAAVAEIESDRVGPTARRLADCIRQYERRARYGATLDSEIGVESIHPDKPWWERETDAEIERLAAAGVSARAIAAKVGLSPATVARKILKNRARVVADPPPDETADAAI